MFSGVGLSLLWAIPFAGLLASLAIGPIAARHFWHRHYGEVTAFWAISFLIPFALVYGPGETLHRAVHALLLDYLPFVLVLLALYTVAGGIVLRGTLVGTPALNTGLLAVGSTLASAIGTTGASMLLIRPLLRANEKRKRRVHTIVFFIILVGNVGGALTPLGDPPLFIGFLKNVDFFWTMRALALPTFALAGALLAMFYALDRYFWRTERPAPPQGAYEPIAIDGAVNFPLLAGIVGAVLLSGVWKPNVSLELAGTPLELQDLVRDVALLALTALSLLLTPRELRERNAFEWGPIAEVAKLFAGMFLTVIPVIAMLQAGRSGAFASVVALVTDTATGAPRYLMYLWITGFLSAFLDNAPTYLVFFNLAGGDPVALMGPYALTLKAISAGAVYFGALTYVGNAPNFMIRSIAEKSGVAMPGFFAYFAYASAILLPLIAILGWLWVLM